MSWLDRGFAVFAREDAVADWAQAAIAPALAAIRDPAIRKAWLRHGGTWFAGVDLLENDAAGKVGAGPPLAGAALDAAQAVCGPLALHRAQLSVTYPGYPARDAADSDTAHRYRLTRDAAHLDGLLPEGPDKRRHLREPHGYILGVALTGAGAGAAPLVVYAGSHHVMRAAFTAAFLGHGPASWGDLDVTEVYQEARRQCFARCQRVEVVLEAGQSVLVHRMALHGIAPWAENAQAGPDGRIMAYLRPVLPDIGNWLALP
ncbi:hypothetical protein [Roseicyclus sp.]|uniref:hypothetical protein n=1 Tax=Roseicyclus sp. TaxID=1914329 RepID=UPI003F6CCCBB